MTSQAIAPNTTLMLTVSPLENGGFLVLEIGPTWEPVKFGVGLSLAEALANYADNAE